MKEPGHQEPVDYGGFLGFDRRLCLLRDPRDWLVSATLFTCQQKESIYGDEKAMVWVMDYLKRKEENPHSLPLKRLLEYIMSAPPALDMEVFGKRSQARHEFCIAFQNSLRENVLPVRYEDFVDGRNRALEEYLEIQLHGHSRVDEVHEHVPRTCSYGNWRDWLTEEDVEFFKPFFDDYICHYGYDSDWYLNEHPQIQPAHCSQYVNRVVQLKKRQWGN